MLQAVSGIAGEAIAQNLVRLLHNDKSIFVPFHHQLLQFRQLPFFHHGQDYFFILPTVVAMAIQEGHTPIQLLRHICGDFIGTV